jgi:phosphosulfolactate phosphohydrolase-like enzyme
LAFEQAEDDLTGRVMEAKHAKHLVKLGFMEDVIFSSRLNVSQTVPVYSHGRLTLQE